ncbi:MAG TPA: Gfo/Idh/MocA family oxidoreductase [Methanomassiliicoccaceae archaeon]|nr:Gfo/Idh/MocA family oxidoreductase [Methanomassiliicoccaceae archaeon]
MRHFNVAVLGVGYWGKKIVDEYHNIPGVNVRAVSDKVDKNLDFCRDRYGVENLFHDYREALEDPSITAVNIALPNSLHYQATRDALEAGKHVLVEKPIALTSREGKELVDLAEEMNLTLSVGHIYRFNNAMNEVRRLLRSNFFGRTFFMNLMWMNLEPSYPDRDVIVDLAPHTFDITNFIFDDWPCKISCTGAAYRRKSMEETAFISAQMPDGVIAHATLSWLTPRRVRQVEIVGENRSALIDAVSQEVTIYESGYTYRLGVERNNTIQTELVHFLRSIGDPLTETRNSGAIGVRTVEMIEAAKRSLAEGRSIEVPQGQ